MPPSFQVPHFAHWGVDKTMAQADISAGTDAQEPKTGAAGIGLADA